MTDTNSLEARKAAADMLGIPVTEVAAVEENPAGPVIRTTDGVGYVVVADGRPGHEGDHQVMVLERPKEGAYSGALPVFGDADAATRAPVVTMRLPAASVGTVVDLSGGDVGHDPRTTAEQDAAAADEAEAKQAEQDAAAADEAEAKQAEQDAAGRGEPVDVDPADPTDPDEAKVDALEAAPKEQPEKTEHATEPASSPEHPRARGRGGR